MPQSRREPGPHPLSWRSRSFRAVVGLALLVLMLRLAWGWQTGRTLRAQRDEIRRRGEPAALEEVRFDKIRDADNAWFVQQQAAAVSMTGPPSPRASNDEYREYPPYSAAWMKRAGDSEKAHAQAFALARRARQLPRAQLRTAMPNGRSSNMLTGLGTARNLANTVSDGALYLHVNGDDAEAIERVLDVLHVGRSLHQDPALVSQLVGRGVDVLAFNTAQIMAPGLRFERPATREGVRHLIAELMDEESVWRGFEQSMVTERLLVSDFIQWQAEGTWVIRPLADREQIRLNRNMDVTIAASRVRDEPRGMAELRRAGWEPVPDWDYPALVGGGGPTRRIIPRYSRWFSVPCYYTRAFEMHYRTIAEQRMTVVSLAVQLYRADHGKWPERLAELVPAYLPAVPQDPYDEDGRGLGYVVRKGALPRGGDRPLVYYDEGPDCPTAVRPEPMYSYERVRDANGTAMPSARQYRDLSRFEPPPLPKAVDHDPDAPGAPGEQPQDDAAPK